MSQELPNSHPEKWVYTEHARAKHAILHTYLGAWLPILGARHQRLVVVDGFAGRGRYRDGEDGSPIVIWRRAVEAVDSGRVDEVGIHCVEANGENFENLSEELASLDHPLVSIRAAHDAFAEVANRIVPELEKRGNEAPPAFWTVDPFGFRGVPLATIRRVMRIPRSEVLITFMVQTMRRFLNEPNFEPPLTEFFGGDAWRGCIDTYDESREQCLLLRYSELVRQHIAEFATPFRVFEDERRQTLYYLVHLSNHALGMRKMKEAMVKESPDMTFWPVTVRPPDQLALDTAEGEPYPGLQDHLCGAYRGRQIVFGELLNRDYPSGLWLEPQYRAAILDLEKAEHVEVARPRTTPTGRKPRGLQEGDVITFSDEPLRQ